MIAPTSFFADYGCHVRILEEARILQKLGQRVKIVTYYKGRNLDGLEIERTPPLPWHAEYEVGSSRHKYAFDVLLAGKSLQVALRFRPDVIHAHLHEGALIGAVLSRLTGAPLVFDFQGSMTSEMIDHKFLRRDGLTYPFWRWLEAQINHWPHLILTSSQLATRLLQDEFDVPKGRVQALPDCVNVEVFRPRCPEDEAEVVALKTQWGIPLERTVVVYVGLLAEYQGTGLLLQAAHRVLQMRRDVHFLIMGFPSVELYRAQAAALGLNDHVTFTGRMPYQDLPAHLRLGDIAVAPKISATEGQGKLLNYLACALPVVAFDTPVNREYLSDYGIYARAGDAEALAAALLQFMVAPDHGRELGQRLRQRAEACFAWEEAGARLLTIYQSLLSAKGRPVAFQAGRTPVSQTLGPGHEQRPRTS